MTNQIALLASAASGVVRLRRLILDLAVSGRLTRTGPRWREIALRDLVVSSGAGWSPSCDAHPREGDAWGVLKVSSVSWGKFRPEENKALPLNLTPRPELEVQKGDFLVSRANTAELVARSVVVESTPPKLMLSDKIVRLRLIRNCSSRFVHIVNSATQARQYFAKVAGGTSGSMKNVSREQITALPLRLPPLEEQHRIVAKVDELMALCDRLEARQQDAEAAHRQLVRVLLDRLTQARDAEEFRASWERVAGQFEVLFTTEESVDALLQAIRSIAISGRLVPQLHDEDCATAVLEKTAAMKAGRGSRSAVPIARLDRTEALSLPDRWVLATIADVTICRDGERIPVSKLERETRAKVYDYYGASGVIDKIDGFLFDKPLLLVGEDGANLINRSTPIAFIASGKYWVNNHAHVLEVCSDTVLLYLELFFNAIDLKPYVTGTAQPKLNQAKLNAIRIALPPEAEQRRIVDRVAELHGLCDSLTSRLVVTRGKHAQLAEALVAQALASSR